MAPQVCGQGRARGGGMTKLQYSTEQARAHYEGERAEALSKLAETDAKYLLDDPVNDYATGPVVSERHLTEAEQRMFNDALRQSGKVVATAQPVFANPESCTLGPVKVTEVLEVLKPFARYAGNPMTAVTPTTTDLVRLRSLYLKLGGKL